MKIDVDKLKQDIEKKKSEITMKNNSLGYQSVQPKRRFLHGLAEARRTLQENEETKHIKSVDYVANKKSPVDNIKSHLDVPTQQPKQHIPQPRINYNEDRFDSEFDMRMNTMMSKSGNMPLADAMHGYMQTQPQQYMSQTNTVMGGNSQLNEELVNEIRNTVVDMFFYDKMRKSIKDNEDLIREIVIDVIKSLKKKN